MILTSAVVSSSWAAAARLTRLHVDGDSRGAGERRHACRQERQLPEPEPEHTRGTRPSRRSAKHAVTVSCIHKFGYISARQVDPWSL
jgi:hypothetical protein